MPSPLLLRPSAPLLRLILATFAIYALMALWFPLLPYYNQIPALDVRVFTPTLLSGLFYGLLLVGLFVLHLRMCRELGRLSQGRLLPILLVTLLFCLPHLFTYPINATDVFRYVIRGRISSHYAESPFLTPPNSFANDPFLPLAGEWAGETSPYGPLWESVAAITTMASGDNLLLGVLFFKLLGAVCLLGAAVLLWHLLPHYVPLNSATRSSLTALWAWNPFLLLTFVTDAHNDVLMLFWLLLGALIIRRGRPTIGLLVMGLASLTKPIALLALPFFFIATIRKLEDGRQRLRLALMTIGGGVLLNLLAFAPWAGIGEDPLTIRGTLTTTFGLASRLVSEAIEGASFAPTTLLWFGGLLLPGPPLDITAIGLVAQGLFALFALWLLWQTWRGRRAEQSTAEIFFTYLLQALNFRIWYAVWPFPWLLLEGLRRPYWLRVGLYFLLTSQLSVIIYGHIRVSLLGGDHGLAHLIGVPFTFLLPFLLARFLETTADVESNG